MKMNDEQLKKYRIDLHQIPELGFELHQTNSYLKEKLEEMGYQTISVAKTGIVVYKKGLSDEAIAFRSDMDGLPVHELTNIKYQSKNKNQMHACGHDGHMSMLLGFASYIAKQKDLKKTVVFIFQPAEEGPGGAKVIIEEGIFNKFNIKRIYGIHLYPNLDQGLYGLVNGPMMAQNGEFNLKISGRSAHGAEPHLGRDSILAASELISQFHQIISRNLDPLENAVITVGTIHGGEARNIISKEVYLTGTIRSFNDLTYQQIKTRMHKISQGISLGFDLSVDLDIIDYYPAVINDDTLYQELKNHLNKDEYQLIKPMMFAEDFAFYQRVVPGMFVMLGTKNETKGFTHPLHSCYFNFDESVLTKGVELYTKLAKINGIL
jgi:amidohydrolase